MLELLAFIGIIAVLWIVSGWVADWKYGRDE